jgi:hypothetical protein
MNQGEKKAFVYLDSRFTEGDAALSPDGEWDRIQLRCFKAERDLRRKISDTRKQATGIREWRVTAAMESRRKGTLLHCPRPQIDGTPDRRRN